MRALGTEIAYHTGSEHSCTWTSVPIGAFGQTKSLTVAASREPLSKFKLMLELTPRAVALPAVGPAVFGLPRGNPVIVWAWKGGIIHGLSTLTVAAPLGVERATVVFALGRI
jgi:hypothetical protein